MASFSFGFDFSDSTDASVIASDPLLPPDQEDEDSLVRATCERIERPSPPAAEHSTTSEFAGITVRRMVQSSGSLSDLLPGQYEGGGAVWECSMDLSQILATGRELLPFNKDESPKSLLELGCGTAIPGIVALLLLRHIQHAIFVDFNKDVVENITWPNILLNCPEDKLSSVCCMAGDWNACEYPEGGFDLILTAETLYTAETTKQVFRLISKLLKPGGIALVASKKYYFGVGGGTYDLDVLCKAATSCLEYEMIARFEDAHSNVREVIRLTRKQPLSTH